MSAGRYDLIIEQGTTFRRVIKLKQPDGTLVNLQDWQARGQIRATVDAATSLAFTCAVNEGTSEITISLTAVQTAAMAPGRHVYDLEVVDISGNILRLMKGILKVDPEVTR